MSSHYSGQAGLVAGPKLTESDQDHLRAIYDAGGARAQIRMGRVAKVVGNSPATVTVAVKRLHARGLVDYERYKGVRLMPEGERLALEMVRHHRLIERFLVEFLGYDWKDVHEEADRLEHAISEELERRIAARVSDPTTDPHGEPIPTEALEAVDDEASTLTTTPSGQHVTVARVSDRDRAILDYLTEIGLLPGVSVHVQERLPFDGPLEIRIGDRIHHLGRSVSDRVFVLPDDSDAAASGSG